MNYLQANRAFVFFDSLNLYANQLYFVMEVPKDEWFHR
jgi:hypothetical protein